MTNVKSMSKSKCQKGTSPVLFKEVNVMNSATITLCNPDSEKSCFACCPPIRPAGYDHSLYKNMVKRILRENTNSFDKGDDRIVPITGFSCWALGYLDEAYKRIGCLLHPCRHGGVDLRYRVDYGNKCARETCPASKFFDALTITQKTFWLQLVDGFDAFSYSSRKANPLFNLMPWGCHLLRLIPVVEGDRRFTWESFLEAYPFFETKALPRNNAYLINRLVHLENIHLLTSKRFKDTFEQFSAGLSVRLSRKVTNREEGSPVHRLNMDRDFLDFLRLSLSITKTGLKEAIALKEMVDEQCEQFGRGLR